MGKPFYTMFISNLKHKNKIEKLCKMLMVAVFICFFLYAVILEYKSSSGTIQNEQQKNNIETVTQLHGICLLMTNNKKQCEYIENIWQ